MTATTSTASQREQHEKWLLELTGIPTAAGREQRVIRWIEKWVNARKGIGMTADRDGNLYITQQVAASNQSTPHPLLITAHLDHPAFVVRRSIDQTTVELEFRGGVREPYFKDADIVIYDSNDREHTGRISDSDFSHKPFSRHTIRLDAPADTIASGDVGRWRFQGKGASPTISDGLLHTPACDDLAAVAAALSALDVLRKRKGNEHVGLLFTRAEEVGFIGAIAACRRKAISKQTRLICLENSRSYPESPIGGGPILRIGDKVSVFDPRLTNRISRLMTEYVKDHSDFAWQRKLMPGGTCEATTFSTFGYQSTCLCLPLGNYHNMVDVDAALAGDIPAQIAPEYISVEDYHGLINMLCLIAARLDDDERVKPIRTMMDDLFKERQWVLGE